MPKVRLLVQKTGFCAFARGRIEEGFRGKLLCESIGSYRHGLEAMEGHAHDEPTILLWGDGMMHQFSNILNIPSSVKYVFDDHDDDHNSRFPDFDSHNLFSQEEGVIVRVCRRLSRGYPGFSMYDEREGNGLLHVSVDLDFIKGFPALPWMSTGSGDNGQLCVYLESLAKRRRLVRFDIGGFSENPGDASSWDDVYDRFYLKVLESAIGLMRTDVRDSSLP